MEFWGFRRNMGRMWTVLYLAPEPLSAADLAKRLQLSAGAVSMTLPDLSKWGVVRKLGRPGERREYFEPETSIWKMVSRVFRERELVQIELAIEAFERARQALSEERKDVAGEARTQLEFVLGRVEGLLSIAQIGDRILRGVLAGESVNSLPLVNLNKLGES